MGNYSNNLQARLKPKVAKEYLKSTAILRDGKVYDGFKSHWALRASLDPNKTDYTRGNDGDVEGFVTTKDRFVTRQEAIAVAVASGQIDPAWKNAKRPLLSSDIDW